MAYLNNIIIYLNSEKEYKEYIKWVLSRLYKENMPVIIKKYKFYTKKTDFVGFIIKLKQIRFCNYYRRFIANWLSKTKPFTKMTKKDKNWKWDEE